MRNKWHMDKDIAEGKSPRIPKKLEPVSDADFA